MKFKCARSAATTFALVVALIVSQDGALAAEKVEFQTPLIFKVWKQARSDLSEPRLRSLVHELQSLDYSMVEASRLVMKGEDEGVKIQQKNREELGRVLDAYGLTAYDEMGPVHSDRHFEDPMKLKDNDLIEIWKNARQSQKFSEDELKSLWRELLDHKTQLDEYRSNEKAVHSKAQNPIKQETKTRALEEDHKRLQNNLIRIRSKVEGATTTSKKGNFDMLELTDTQIRELWVIAKNKPLSSVDKQQIKVSWHF
jgi:Zn-dependent M32 family carboxypeptidase